MTARTPPASSVRGSKPISRRTLAFFENDNAFDIGAARRSLGFEPRTELPGGARAVIAGSAAG